jgi:8-oxo-dGTP diphosphatase
MIHENTFKKIYFNGVKGLVFFGGKILVYRRDTNTKNYPRCIDLPGGGREGEETPFETFRREVVEEFGFTLSEEDITFSFEIPSFSEPGEKSYFIVTNPLSITGDDVVFGDEGEEWLLMSPDEFVARTDGIERLQKRVAKYLIGELISE